MSFSREELMSWHIMSQARLKEITEVLIGKLNANESLTLAESKFICLGLRTIYSVETDEVVFKAEDFSQCDDFLFWNRYLLYWANHEGWGEVRESKDRVISEFQKQKDVKLLHKHFEQWKSVIYSKKYDSELLNVVGSETIRLINELIEYSKMLGEGSNRRIYIEKALVLHSKYLYYHVAEYYEELKDTKETIKICNNLIVVDCFVYTHTLFGHFAEGVKFNRLGKSYHKDGSVDFRNIPKEILRVLEVYAKHIDCKSFNKASIFFSMNNIDYAIWFRAMSKSLKGGVVENYLRVQTFYPIELQEEREKIAAMDQIKINNEMIFYV